MHVIDKCQSLREEQRVKGQEKGIYPYQLGFISKKISKQKTTCKNKRSNINVPIVTNLLNMHRYLLYCFLSISLLK